MDQNRWSMTKRWWWYLSPATLTPVSMILICWLNFAVTTRAMRVIAIAAESSDIVAAGPHIILPPSRHFIDVEQAFCFLMYAQTFALMQSLHMGNTPDTPSASGTVNRVVQGVIIHPWQA